MYMTIYICQLHIYQVHPSGIFTTHSSESLGKLEPLSADFGEKQGAHWAGHQYITGLTL